MECLQSKWCFFHKYSISCIYIRSALRDVYKINSLVATSDHLITMILKLRQQLIYENRCLREQGIRPPAGEIIWKKSDYTVRVTLFCCVCAVYAFHYPPIMKIDHLLLTTCNIKTQSHVGVSRGSPSKSTAITFGAQSASDEHGLNSTWLGLTLGNSQGALHWPSCSCRVNLPHHTSMTLLVRILTNPGTDISGWAYVSWVQ